MYLNGIKLNIKKRVHTHTHTHCKSEQVGAETFSVETSFLNVTKLSNARGFFVFPHQLHDILTLKNNIHHF